MSNRRSPERSDEGNLILVLVVSVLLIAAVAVAISTAIGGLGESGRFSGLSQSTLAAQSGLAQELTTMKAASTYASLPCSLQGNLTAPGAISAYSVTVTYFSANGTAITCSGAGSTLGGTTTPAAATLRSTGAATHATSFVMNEDVNIAVASSATLSPAFNYTIFTPSGFQWSNSTTLNDLVRNDTITSTGGTAITDASSLPTDVGGIVTFHSGSGTVPAGTTVVSVGGTGFVSSNPIPATVTAVTVTVPPNIYIAGSTSCTNQMHSAGGIISYQAISFGNQCNFGGNVTSAVSVTFGNGTVIGGNVTSFGGGITLNGGTTVAGNATAIGGSAGNAAGTITGSGGAKVTATAAATGTISGITAGTTTQNDSLIASQTMPTPTSWPTEDPSAATLAANGWSVVSVATGSCGTYFAENPTSPFETAMLNATVKTAIYAPTCAVSFGGNDTFKTGADMVVDIASWGHVSNNETFQSTTSTPHNFSLLVGVDNAGSPVACNSTATINSSAVMTFNSTTNPLNVLIYTPGKTLLTQSVAFTGQFMSCGGVQTSQNLTITFSPAPALELFGSTTSSSSPTMTVVDKYH